MKFWFLEMPALPPLAWCACVRRNEETVVVRHGGMVETFAHAFVEGAWDGAFHEAGFPGARVMCGTGGVAGDAGVRFCAGTDMLNPLATIAARDSITVSNSVVHAMVGAGEEPHPLYPFYGDDAIAIWRQGLYRSNRSLRTRSGAAVRLHFGAVLHIDPALTVGIGDYAAAGPPEDYRAYRSLLADAVKAVFVNAADRRRRFPYEPVSSISRGYDSCAGGVLAREAGCTQAVTYLDFGRDDPRRDAGTGIAQALGMHCDEFDRLAYKKHVGAAAEAEFSMFPRGGQTSLFSLSQRLRQTVFVVGQFGGVIWHRERAAYTRNLAQCGVQYMAGAGFGEFRLRVGCIVLGPAFIGARHSEAIQRISNSPEMRPWCVGGGYDRPIPRRLAEEAGLAREQFGRKKMATGYTNLDDPHSYSRSSLDEYLSFTRAQHAGAPAAALRYWQWRLRLRYLILSACARLTGTRKKKKRRPTWLRRRFTFVLDAPPKRVPWEMRFTFQWAFQSLRDRYAGSSPHPFRVHAGSQNLVPDPATDGATMPGVMHRDPDRSGP